MKCAARLTDTEELPGPQGNPGTPFPSRRNTGQVHSSECWGRRWPDADSARAFTLHDVIFPLKRMRTVERASTGRDEGFIFQSVE